MSLRDQAQELMTEMGQTLKLDGLVFDHNDECVVVFDDKVVTVFQIDEDTNSIICSAVLGMLPEHENREEALFELLCGNYFWAMTAGATIGVDRNSGLISLCYLVELPLPEKTRFIDIVAKIVNNAEYWMAKLSSLEPDKEASGPLLPSMRV